MYTGAKRGAKAKPLTKDMILRAMKYTKSVRSAAKYLGCSYQHLKPYMKMFLDDETGKSLFDLHKNQKGVGIAKWLPNKRKEPNVKNIIETGTGWESFTPEKIKTRLIAESYLRDECYSCGFAERRVTDYKIPLLLNFKDGNKFNYILDNLELICYNCYFLYVADPLSQDQIRHVQDSVAVRDKPFDWGLDSDVLANMKLFGIE